MQTRAAQIVVLSVALQLLLATPALAYLEPGASSLFWQVILAVVAAIALTFRGLWATVSGVIARALGRKKS